MELLMASAETGTLKTDMGRKCVEYRQRRRAVEKDKGEELSD